MWAPAREALAYVPALAMLVAGVWSMLTFAPLITWHAGCAPCSSPSENCSLGCSSTGNLDLLGPVLLAGSVVSTIGAYFVVGRRRRAAWARELQLA
ncbi:MAG: hypothetical protein L3K15_01005 [Thermoplasmata archaeon]|nr:hypothetical protein [Thermoplasmata archaeon]